MTSTQQQALALDASLIIYEDKSANFEDVELADEDDGEKEEEPATTDRSSTVDDENEEEVATPEEEEQSSSRTLVQRIFSFRVLIGLLLVGFVIFVIVDSATTGYVRDTVSSFLDWIEENPMAGFFVFVLVYFAATVLFVPGTILTLGAGFVFSMAFGLGGGVALGSLSVFLGASMGAIASFLLGRYLLREQIGKLSNRYAVFEAIESTLKDNGLKIFILLRLSPVIPFNVINYIGGVSSVSFRDYVIALFAILPGTILYVFLGASAGSLADSASSGQNSTVTIVIIVVGAVFGILAICLTTRYARKELNRVLEERRRGEEQAEATGDVEASPAPTSDNNNN